MTEAARKPTRRGLVESELLEQAAVLFAERGFSGTTLQDVADTLGLTRAALYHYFESKEAMLAALIEGITITRASQLRLLRLDAGLSYAEKLTAITRMMVVNVVTQAARFRLLLQSERELPAELAEQHAAARRETLAQIVGLFEEGIAAGEFKPADPHVAAFALLGMCNWTAWWYKLEQNGPPEAIGDQLAGFALAAFGQSPASSAQALGDVRSALRKVREDLAAVERAIGPP